MNREYLKISKFLKDFLVNFSRMIQTIHPRIEKSLFCRNSIFGIEGQHLLDELNGFRRHVLPVFS